MTTINRAGGVALLAIIACATLGIPSNASAATRYSDWRNYWHQSGEGEVSDAEEQEAVSRRGVSSSIRKKIDKLDDDAVDDLVIPILFGAPLSSLTKNFGDPRDGGDRSHEGLDIMAAKGSYIVSPTEGVVIRTGTGGSAGKYVYVAAPGDETFVYMHLDDFGDIKAGTELKKGDLIGYVGNTGNASGGPAHLHFEIRDGRTPSDPFPRLNEEFTLKERIAAVKDILADADEEGEEADALVRDYRSIFVAAVAEKIDLPESIEEALEDAGVVGVSAGYVRDLTLGSQGTDVIALQAFLIGKDSGAKAKALASAGATGYFGAMTQAALAEYQAASGITPSVGYFGALTRAKVAAGS